MKHLLVFSQSLFYAQLHLTLLKDMLLMPSNAKYCIKQRCYIMHGIQLLYHYSLSPHSQVQAPQATTTINGCIRKATHTKQQQYDL